MTHIKTIKNGAIGVQTGAHAPVGGNAFYDRRFYYSQKFIKNLLTN
jgi:hypothetical protein